MRDTGSVWFVRGCARFLGGITGRGGLRRCGGSARAARVVIAAVVGRRQPRGARACGLPDSRRPKGSLLGDFALLLSSLTQQILGAGRTLPLEVGLLCRRYSRAPAAAVSAGRLALTASCSPGRSAEEGDRTSRSAEVLIKGSGLVAVVGVAMRVSGLLGPLGRGVGAREGGVRAGREIEDPAYLGVVRSAAAG